MIWSKKSIVNLSTLTAVLIILLMRPYFVWLVPEMAMAVVSVFVTVIAVANISFKKNRNIDILFLLAFAYLFLSLLRGAHLGGTLINLSFAFLPFTKKDFLLNVYEVFRIIIICVFFISMVSYGLVLAGIQSPSEMIEPLNDLKPIQYAKFFFLVLPAKIDGIARYCSIFDEPGVIGTMSALMLCIEGFSFKRKGNIIILLNGLISLSLFFYLIITIYLLLRLSLKYKLIFVIGVAILYATTANNDVMKVAIWDRLTLNDDGSLAGDNRNTEAFKTAWDKAKYEPQILTGYGIQLTKEYEDSASIQLFIMRDGLLFVLMYFIVYIVLAFRNIKSIKEFFLFVLVLFLTLYQRPGFCSIDYTLLFSAYIFSYSKKNVSISRSSNLQLSSIS